MLYPLIQGGFARNASEALHPDLWSGLKAAWAPVLGHTGDILHDFSGNGVDANVVDVPISTAWSVGAGGYQLDFVGDGQYATIGSTDLGGNKGTIICWVNPSMIYNQGSPFTFAIIGSGSSSRLIQIIYNSTFGSSRFDAVVRGNFGNYVNLSGPSFVSNEQLQQPHCVALTWDADTDNHQFYVDGSLADSSTVDLAAWGGDTNWRIGDGITANSSWTGGILSIAPYSRVLSDAEIMLWSRHPAAMFIKKRRKIVAAIESGPVFSPFWISNNGVIQ